VSGAALASNGIVRFSTIAFAGANCRELGNVLSPPEVTAARTDQKAPERRKVEQFAVKLTCNALCFPVERPILNSRDADKPSTWIL
jgi:hypothetical protein